MAVEASMALLSLAEEQLKECVPHPAACASWAPVRFPLDGIDEAERECLQRWQLTRRVQMLALRGRDFCVFARIVYRHEHDARDRRHGGVLGGCW